MKSKALCLLLVLLLAVSLAACGSDEESFGNEQTVPLDLIIDALRSGNAETYESAFPADFLNIYRSGYPDIDEIIGTLIGAGRNRDESVYGADAEITYELLKSEPMPVNTLATQIYYDSIDEFLYYLPIDQISEARMLQIRVHRGGSFSESDRVLECTVLKFGGKWVLHPSLFGSLLN